MVKKFINDVELIEIMKAKGVISANKIIEKYGVGANRVNSIWRLVEMFKTIDWDSIPIEINKETRGRPPKPIILNL